MIPCTSTIQYQVFGQISSLKTLRIIGGIIRSHNCGTDQDLTNNARTVVPLNLLAVFHQLEFKQQIHYLIFDCSLFSQYRYILTAPLKPDHVKLYVFKPLSGPTPAEAPAVRKGWRKFGASPTQDVRLILYSYALLLCAGVYIILKN